MDIYTYMYVCVCVCVCVCVRARAIVTVIDWELRKITRDYI
jgi:hypothetical protein